MGQQQQETAKVGKEDKVRKDYMIALCDCILLN